MVSGAREDFTGVPGSRLRTAATASAVFPAAAAIAIAIAAAIAIATAAATASATIPGIGRVSVRAIDSGVASASACAIGSGR